jgi:hypothetical protein
MASIIMGLCSITTEMAEAKSQANPSTTSFYAAKTISRIASAQQ